MKWEDERGAGEGGGWLWPSFFAARTEFLPTLNSLRHRRRRRTRTQRLRGHVHMMSALGAVEGGPQKADKLRLREFYSIQGWAKEWPLGCVSLAS